MPPPPPADAQNLTKLESAGHLRIHERRFDELRRSDPTFPQPKLLSPAIARWTRASLDRWLEGRPSGWCSTGGRREGAFVGRSA